MDRNTQARKRLQMKYQKIQNTDGSLEVKALNKQGQEVMSSEVKFLTDEDRANLPSHITNPGNLIPISALNDKNNPLTQNIKQYLKSQGINHTASQITELIQQSIKASGIEKMYPQK